MRRFVISPAPGLYYGKDIILELPDLIAENGIRKIALITGKSSFPGTENWKKFTDYLKRKGIEYIHFSASGENDPVAIDRIVASLSGEAVDAVIAVGGGTVLDAGKAVSAMLCMEGSITDYLEGVGTKTPTGAKLPFYAVPTTSGTGSEATKNAVISRIGPGGFKKSLRHNKYIPEAAFLDPALITSCPQDITAASGLDAITQLIEAYVSTGHNKYTDALAVEGLRFAGKSFPWTIEEGTDVEARGSMALAAYLSGIALANAGLGVIHGAASTLGAMHKIPHGVVCGTLLGAATERIIEKLSSSEEGWNNSALKRYAGAGVALNGKDAGSIEDNCMALVNRLHKWIKKYAIKRLGDYGFTKQELKSAAGRVSLKNTPVKLDQKEIELILVSRL
ncbi:MAG: alcohol dehydrogenase [Spirochaetes bacterium]|nr:MAG: alcohol dehydrogenase [Spirochaetota bacterium]